MSMLYSEQLKNINIYQHDHHQNWVALALKNIKLSP